MRLTIFAFFLVLLLPVSAKAFEFGFGPCCSGYLCGIVPCDKTCAGPAIGEFGASFSAGLDRISSNLNSYTDETLDTSSQASSFFQDVGASIGDFTEQFLSGIDANSRQMELLSQMHNTAYEQLADLVTNTFSQSLVSSSKVEGFLDADKSLSERAVSPSLKRLMQLQSDTLQYFLERNEAMDAAYKMAGVAREEPEDAAIHNRLASYSNLVNELDFRGSKLAHGQHLFSASETMPDNIQLYSLLSTLPPLSFARHMKLLAKNMAKPDIETNLFSNDTHAVSLLIDRELQLDVAKGNESVLTSELTIQEQLSSRLWNHLHDLIEFKSQVRAERVVR